MGEKKEVVDNRSAVVPAQPKMQKNHQTRKYKKQQKKKSPRKSCAAHRRNNARGGRIRNIVNGKTETKNPLK